MKRIIIFVWVVMFFSSVKTVNADCLGGWNCTYYDDYASTCLNDIPAGGSGSCAQVGTDEDCNPSGANCAGGCINDRCRWDDGGSSCSCSWGSWSSCYGNSTGTACVKDRDCTCDPVSCGSCSGDSWTKCTAAEKGCTEQNCPTDAGYAGGSVRDGTLNSDCKCGLKTCPAICTPTDPDTPTLYAPGTGTSIPVNQSVNLDWNAISNWGTGCPQDNDYEVCVMSNDDNNCNYVNLTRLFQLLFSSP